MSSLGYNIHSIGCGDTTNGGKCTIVSKESGQSGYCVYECNEDSYYYYRVKSRMIINVPIINELLSIPVFSNTNRLYDFSKLQN